MHTTEYAGPGREVPPPDDLEEVKIGWFGPKDDGDEGTGMMWQAATMAVEEANQAGGFQGLPFRLVPGWSVNPWGTGIRDVTRLVYEERVWALVGAPDGPSAHLAAQVVAKARLVFISPVSTDKTTNLANVPWIFSCAPGDHLQAATLADSILAQSEGCGVAVVSATDHDSRLFTTELLSALNKREVFPALHLRFRAGCTDFAGQLADLADGEVKAIALIAGADDSARFLTTLRRDDPEVAVIGGTAMGRADFLEAAGSAADGVTFPLLWHQAAAGERSSTFFQHFHDRFGVKPDYTAAHTYDAVNLLTAAVKKAGLNRVRIRDAVRELSPFSGVTGVITWDPTGSNLRPVQLGTIHNGRRRPAGEP
ncbi:MAG: ABC transporter substrate-binding protein [Phycisphaerales bacterium]|nr:MAG: ABC transporter substrate-binding protein [Phycisphaerales bacterium]